MPASDLPSPFTLAASPEFVRRLSDKELNALAREFVASLGGCIHQSCDMPWYTFVQNYKDEAAGRSRLASLMAPDKRDNMASHVSESQFGLAVDRKGGFQSSDGPPAAPAPLSPSASSSGRSTRGAGGAEGSAPTNVLPRTSLEHVVRAARRAGALLGESDLQLRRSLNLVATSRRRIVEQDRELRALRYAMSEANAEIVALQTAARDIRVRQQQDEREMLRTLDRLSAAAPHTMAEAHVAVRHFKALKQELVTMAPVFPEHLNFHLCDLVYEDEPLTRRVRVCLDVSGRRWAVWGELRQAAGPKLASVVRNENLPQPTDHARVVERVMCFRPFVVQKPGSAKAAPPGVLVAWDWPRLGHGLRIAPRKK